MMALLHFDCWPGWANKMGAVSNSETSVWKNQILAALFYPSSASGGLPKGLGALLRVGAQLKEWSESCGAGNTKKPRLD